MRWVGSIFVAILAAAAPQAAAAVDYRTDIQPILAKHCYSCHGALRQKGSLRLDHVSFIRTGGDSGPAIAAAGAESLLVHAIKGTGDVERMPLEAKPLADEEIAKLEAWVAAGAPAPDEPLPNDPRRHWSFQKPVRPELPTVSNPTWSSHPVDRFLAVEHERQGLSPSEPAAKNVLLRRVYLDLVGIPPSPEELRAFLADESPAAYERVVDRLLASPQYGERWGRHWMDVWRYSDWDGYAAEVRESQPHIWRWRDWIVESLNADRPYDEMVRLMLAADELAPDKPDEMRASGFLVRNWYRFNRNVWLEATVEHTSKAFLGITLNCARCHDHMYDPIQQTEYYQFRAFFEPHNIRTDRLPGQSDTKQVGLVRVFDEKADAPTYLFARGNEGQPVKDQPLPPGVPAALGGMPPSVAPINLAPQQYYPGLQPFVQQEALAQAQSAVDRSETAMTAASEKLADARKKLAEFIAAKQPPAKDAQPAAATNTGDPAAKDAPPAEKPAEQAVVDEATLRTNVTAAEAAASLTEHELLTAAAGLVAARAKIAADNGAFAQPPAANATELAREASRAERIFASHDAGLNVKRAEQSLEQAKSGTDEAAKKKIPDAEKKLAEARKAHETAQAALGKPSDQYTRFTPVYPATTTGRRAALAGWIASNQNPLTARVAINHIWLRHFGSPLVPTVFDFGLNGKAPTHPALLDWLAVELMENGWRTKPIHRLLLTSTAYRMQSTSTNEGNLKLDPENHLLWRMNPRRMEAEAVRDSTLAVAGSLDLTLGGADLDENSGLSVPRRSLYFRSSKEKKVTFLEMFDRANVTDCYRRSETVVPQQALAMINSTLALGEARRLAGRLTTAETADPAAFISAAYERILCRAPSERERAMCQEFLTAQAARFADKTKLAPFTAGPDNPIKPADDPVQRARENLVHVLLNHNDFLTIR